MRGQLASKPSGNRRTMAPARRRLMESRRLLPTMTAMRVVSMASVSVGSGWPQGMGRGVQATAWRAQRSVAARCPGSEVEAGLAPPPALERAPALLGAAPAADGALEEQTVRDPQRAAARLAGLVDFLQRGVDQVDVAHAPAQAGLVAAVEQFHQVVQAEG